MLELLNQLRNLMSRLSRHRYDRIAVILQLLTSSVTRVRYLFTWLFPFPLHKMCTKYIAVRKESMHMPPKGEPLYLPFSFYYEVIRNTDCRRKLNKILVFGFRLGVYVFPF